MGTSSVPRVLSDQIRQFRRQAKFTQAQLAAKTGLLRKTIAGLESGRGSIRSTVAVIDALGLQLVGLPSGSTLGQRIKLRRLQRRISQRRLAALSGISHPVVVRIETGSKGLLTNLERIAQTLRSPLLLRPKNPSNKGLTRFTGRSSRHETPLEFMEVIHRAVPMFDLDPCGSPTSHVRARHFYFEEQDGLTQPWHGRVWLNPPYRNISHWVPTAPLALRKVIQEL